MRDRFPILEHTNYLISNSLGAVPVAAGASLQSYYETWATRGVRAWEEAWWSLVSDLGDLVAPADRCPSGRGRLPAQRDDRRMPSSSAPSISRRTANRIVTDAMHFPSILYLLDQETRDGAERGRHPFGGRDVASTPSGSSRRSTSARRSSASRTSSSSRRTSTTSRRSPRRRGVSRRSRIIDGYQAVGTIPVDVRALGIDVYIGGCLKWLCGGPGAAFLWVDPDVRRRLEPRLTGWMAHQQPFAFDREARRAATMPGDCSTGRPASRPSTRPGPGWRSSIEAGIDAIRAKSIRQTQRLLDLADRHGYRCTTPRDPSRRGGTVAIDVENGYEVSQSLKSLDILCDYRPGAGIRLSPHFYNRDDELDAAVEAIGEVLATGAWRAFTTGQSTVT